MNLPVPKTALGKAIERLVLLFVAGVLAAVLNDVKLTPAIYFVVKSSLDLLNANIPNI